MKLDFNARQIELLNKLNLPFDFRNDLTDGQICDLDEALTEYFEVNCIIDDETISNDGLVIESILDLIADIE